MTYLVEALVAIFTVAFRCIPEWYRLFDPLIDIIRTFSRTFL